MDEEERAAAGEDVVGGPLEGVLAAPVAVDGDGGRPRAALPEGERGAVPHGGVGDFLAGVLLLRRRDDGLRVERVRHLRAGMVVAGEEEGEGMASTKQWPGVRGGGIERDRARKKWRTPRVWRGTRCRCMCHGLFFYWALEAAGPKCKASPSPRPARRTPGWQIIF